jgi:hypothetical protein
LERYETVQKFVPRAKNHPHTAASDLLLDTIPVCNQIALNETGHG